MLESVKGLVYHRRQGISKVVGFAGAFYLAKRYLNERLEEVKDKLEQESAARDSLRRRFLQTQEDVSYTILALLPTLSEQILEQMDVEALTQELQTRSRARRQQISPHPQQLQFQRPPSSLASSIDLVQEQDTRSDVDSALVRPLETSGLQSWVESTSSAGSHSPARSLAASSAESLNGEGQLLSESMITTTTDSSANGESASIDGSGLSESMISTSAVSDTTDSRTKAELWNEVKILTFHANSNHALLDDPALPPYNATTDTPRPVKIRVGSATAGARGADEGAVRGPVLNEQPAARTWEGSRGAPRRG